MTSLSQGFNGHKESDTTWPLNHNKGFSGDSEVKNIPAKAETQIQSLEKEMATHSNILAWEIPWTEEPVGCSSWGCKESDMTHELNNNKGLNGREDYPKKLYYKENNLFC